mmetsp:Transcript_26276/g.76801  ORF Transcript_26276/g.76801 Transcript_26276/m.76801 type:complete len:309 (-) Transcript_26276:147-1073(-)
MQQQPARRQRTIIQRQRAWRQSQRIQRQRARRQSQRMQRQARQQMPRNFLGSHEQRVPRALHTHVSRGVLLCATGRTAEAVEGAPHAVFVHFLRAPRARGIGAVCPMRVAADRRAWHHHNECFLPGGLLHLHHTNKSNKRFHRKLLHCPFLPEWPRPSLRALRVPSLLRRAPSAPSSSSCIMQMHFLRVCPRAWSWSAAPWSPFSSLLAASAPMRSVYDVRGRGAIGASGQLLMNALTSSLTKRSFKTTLMCPEAYKTALMHALTHQRRSRSVRMSGSLDFVQAMRSSSVRAQLTTSHSIRVRHTRST